MNNEFSAMIKKMIVEKVAEFNKNQRKYKDHVQVVSDLDQGIDELFTLFQAQAVHCAKQSGTANMEKFELQLANSLKNLRKDNGKPRFEYFKSNLAPVFNANKILTDSIAQEIKHDYYSKFRFFIFRVFTTLGIGGAALGIAMFANFMGYETAILKEIKDKPKTEVLDKKPLPKVAVKAERLIPKPE